MLRDGSYKEAQDLTADDSLMPGYFDSIPVKEGLNDYLRVLQPTTGNYEFVHYLADTFNAQRGYAAEVQAAFVRHHKNFDRWDNRPPNIERMGFLEHLHLHAEHIGELWEDEAFREAQRQGVQRYYAEHPEVLEERRHRFTVQNRDPAFRQENGSRTSAGLKHYFIENPQVRADISMRMKALWKDPDYRARMSVVLAGIEKRSLTAEEKARVSQIISEKSREMWSNEEKRAEIVKAILPGIGFCRGAGEIKGKWPTELARSELPRQLFRRSFFPDGKQALGRSQNSGIAPAKSYPTVARAGVP